MPTMHKCWKHIETPTDDLAIGQMFRLYKAQLSEHDYYLSINEYWLDGTAELRLVAVRYDAKPDDDPQELYRVFIESSDFETNPEVLDIRVQKVLASDNPVGAARFLSALSDVNPL